MVVLLLGLLALPLLSMGCSSESKGSTEPALIQSESTTTQTSEAASSTVKNIILMICDGCGYNHVQVVNCYRGAAQVFESFPVKLGMTTYEYENTERKTTGTGAAGDGSPPHDTGATLNLLGYDPVLMWRDFAYCAYPLSTDSASAATALASGVKTYHGAIGVDVHANIVELITERAERLGKATGVVTSVEWSHATPAAFAVHNPDRDDYTVIAQAMIQESALDVIMGTGHPGFDNNGGVAARDPSFVGGRTQWAQLTDGDPGTPTVSDADGDGAADPWTLIQTKADFEALAEAPATPSRVCGTAQVYATLQQARDGSSSAAPFAVPLNSSVPDLATMARGALNVLDDDPDGLFLMIEGGAVDWAAHSNQTGRMIEELTAFAGAVEAVIQWVNEHGGWTQTLLIVTADHETGMLWGPGSGTVEGRAVFAAIQDKGEGNVPEVSWGSTGHTNQLVPLYALGETSALLLDRVVSTDPVRGPYVDNTDVAGLILDIMR